MTGNLMIRKVLLKEGGEQSEVRYDNVIAVLKSWQARADEWYVVLLVQVP